MESKTNSGENKKLSRTTIGTLLFFILLLILSITFILLDGKVAFKSAPENAGQIRESIGLLKEMESRTPSVGQNSGPVEITDMKAEEDKILSIPYEGFNTAELRGWFENSVILGDSITAAAKDYGFLGDDIVFAQVGGSLENSGAQFERARERFPSTVFLCFGSNDVSNYMNNPAAFISKYDEYINGLKAVNPNVVCYISAVFPLQPSAWTAEPGGPFQPDYNVALEQYCSQTDNVYYIDATFILERMPELYESDGVHPTVPFYPKWLTFLADVSGLSSAGN